MSKKNITKYIRFLKNMAYNSAGDIVPIVAECDTDKYHDLYYYDGMNRYCYQKKTEEGNDFEYISEEEYIKECPILQYLGNKKKLVINRDILLQMPPSWQDDLVYLLDKMEHY